MEPLKQKLILSYQEQIDHFKSKGITFNLDFDEKRAIDYLQSHNIFFRLKAYCSDFKNSDLSTYSGLDFSYLVDLARIDDKLRKLILYMSIDVEHFSKVQLLSLITKKCHDLDAYEIVEYYAEWLEKEKHKKLADNLRNNSKSAYVKELYEKYKSPEGTYRFLVQVLLEVASFGTYIYFYEFCIKKLIDNLSNKWREILSLILKVKDARNGAAHDNCFINNLKVINVNYRLDPYMVELLLTLEEISPRVKKRSLQNEKVVQIITCLYSYRELVIRSPRNYYKFLDRPYAVIPNELKVAMQSFSDQLGQFIGKLPKKLEIEYSTAKTLKLIKKVVDSWYLS